MMRDHQNQVAQRAQEIAEGRLSARDALISGYAPDTFTAKAVIQPDGIETGWLPIGALAVGNGFGVLAAPNIGDACTVHFVDGDSNSGRISLCLFNDVDRPPVIQAGEFLLKHQSGTFMKFHADGALEIVGVGAINATAQTASITATTSATVSTAVAAVNATTSASVTAPIINLGAAGQTLRAMVTDLFAALFNGHTHADPVSGNTSAPNQLMDASHVTTTVKGA